MGFVTTVWLLAAGFSLAIAAVAGSVGLVGLERRYLASHTIVLLGLALTAAAYLELLMMHSTTPREYGAWLRWYHVPAFFAVLAQVLFIRLYMGTSRPWLMWTVIAMRLVVLAVDFAVRPNFGFANIASLRRPYFLGEQISVVGQAVPRQGWSWFAWLSLVLMLVYILDAAIQQWRIGTPASKRKAVATGLFIAIPWLLVAVYGQLIVFRVVTGPITNLPWFLGALLVMMFEMTRDYVSSRHALVEVAALRGELMQRERVGALGQLSSALAHQLAQPLTANSVNAFAALKQLDSENPDIEELRATLTDIDRNSRRAAEVIAGMRDLIKNQTIALHPVRMEDVVQEAVVLVRGEVAAKGIALSVVMQPDLPRVMGDRVHLSQVLINLLMNSIHAVQARPPEARRIVVEARTNGHSGEVEMAVQDSGQGIANADVDKLFTPLFTTKPEGMGVGLALSQTIIAAHGGRLWLDRTEGQQGAVFRFTLQQA